MYCAVRFFVRLYNEDAARLVCRSTPLSTCVDTSPTGGDHALQGRIVQYDEKDASKTRTKSNKWSLCGVALNSEERLDLVLGELCADHAHSAGDVSRSGAYLVLLGNKVEVVPNAVSACNDALSA